MAAVISIPLAPISRRVIEATEARRSAHADPMVDNFPGLTVNGIWGPELMGGRCARRPRGSAGIINGHVAALTSRSGVVRQEHRQ